MSENIDNIKKFFVNDQYENLIVPFISEEINFFYFFIAEYFSKKNNFKLIRSDEIISDGMFDIEKKAYICIKPKNNQLEKLLKTNQKTMIFIDYKIFKIYEKQILNLNSFKFKNDVTYFINHILDINNEKLTSGILNNLTYIYSETSKYLTNEIDYSFDITTNEASYDILSLRKDIYKNKNINFNLKNLFNLIKEERLLKKFSFLTS